MKLFIALIASFLIILTGLTFIFQELRINRLESYVIRLQTGYEYTNDLIKAYDDRSLSHFNNLQDSLEERIGTLEHELESLKFLTGKGKK